MIAFSVVYSFLRSTRVLTILTVLSETMNVCSNLTCCDGRIKRLDKAYIIMRVPVPGFASERKLVLIIANLELMSSLVEQLTSRKTYLNSTMCNRNMLLKPYQLRSLIYTKISGIASLHFYRKPRKANSITDINVLRRRFQT